MVSIVEHFSSIVETAKKTKHKHKRNERRNKFRMWQDIFCLSHTSPSGSLTTCRRLPPPSVACAYCRRWKLVVPCFLDGRGRNVLLFGVVVLMIHKETKIASFCKKSKHMEKNESTTTAHLRESDVRNYSYMVSISDIFWIKQCRFWRWV